MTLPLPEPGLVLNYAYLWHDEYNAGREVGNKNRPSVIVFCATNTADQAVTVTVLPITHSTPKHANSAIEIPATIKSHLGLDHERSWIIISEGNEFIWPGYDLRKVSKTDDYSYGFLPPRFFAQVRDAVVRFHKSAGLRLSPRS